MILFDTNLISEALKSACDPHVAAWLNTCPAPDMWTTAINLAELRFGVALLPEGQRKTMLHRDLERLLSKAFENRIIAFDANCSAAFGDIAASMRRRGRAIGVPDCQIAAIAMVHGLTVATRDVQPFADAGVSVISPWIEAQK